MVLCQELDQRLGGELHDNILAIGGVPPRERTFSEGVQTPSPSEGCLGDPGVTGG